MASIAPRSRSADSRVTVAARMMKDGKFLAANAPENVDIPQGMSAHCLGDAAQNLVAGGMAKRIVDRFEVIDIEDNAG